MRSLDLIWRDIRYAARAMGNNLGVAVLAIVSLGFGIGMTSATVSVMYALMLKALPVPQPDQLVEVTPPDPPDVQSYSVWKQFGGWHDIFSDVFAYNWASTEFKVSKEGGAEQPISGLYVTGDFFATLGVPVTVGRALQNSDDSPGAVPVCVISYSFWQRQYRQSHDALRRTIILDGHPFQVVGVAPKGFFGVVVGEKPPDIFMPLEMQRMYRDYPGFSNGLVTVAIPTLDQGATWLQIVARLKPGVSVTKANARLQILGSNIHRVLAPRLESARQPLPPRILVARPIPNGISTMRFYYGNTVLLLMTMAGVALLIVCANLGYLLLARATKRQSEIATRLALGATRSQLIQQLLTESIVLSLAGAIVGFVIAHWASRVVIRVISNPILDLSWDPKLVMFAVGITFLPAVLFGLAPALRATHLQLYSAMNHGFSLGRRRDRLSNALLIAAQVALSMALLISAGLLTRTVQALLAKDPGYEPKGVLIAQTTLNQTGEDPQRQASLGNELLNGFRSLPGVISASWTASASKSTLPHVVIRQPEGLERRLASYRFFISSDYFQTRRTPTRSGRDFNNNDNQTSPAVAIVSEMAARTFFPGLNPIGLRYQEDDGENKGQENIVEVVGVVKDIEYRTPNYGPLPVVYRPVFQCSVCSPNTRYEVRFAGSMPEIIQRLKSAAASIDPGLTFQFRSLADERNNSIQTNRAIALLATMFGLFTGLLVMIGVYGLTSYTTSQRTREIALRMALGAQRHNVVQMILGETMTMVFIGIALGVVAGLGAAYALRELLWGVTPTDPLTFVSAASLILLISGIACLRPARHASQADPLVALRFE